MPILKCILSNCTEASITNENIVTLVYTENLLSLLLIYLKICIKVYLCNLKPE